MIGVLSDLLTGSNPLNHPDGEALTQDSFIGMLAGAVDGLDDQPQVQAWLRELLASVYAAHGRNEEWLAAMEALVAYHEQAGSDSLTLARVRHNLALATVPVHGTEVAVPLPQESLARHRALLGSAHRDVGVAATDLALVIAEDNVLTVLGEDGVQPEGWPWTAPAAGGVINGRVALGDVDGDGLGEMVVPLTERTVILNHLAQVEFVFGAGEAAAGSPSLADFDDDGDLEIVIPRSDGTVHVVHHDGTSAGAAWPYDTGIPGTPSQVALADLAGNDRRDLIFMDAAHSVHAVSPAGIVLLNWEMDVPLGSPVIEPMVAKVGPGERAVIVGGIDGRLRVFTPDGLQDGWPRDMGGEIHAPVAEADVDSDGKMEMVVATTEETWLLDMGVSGPFAWEVWPMSGADPGRRGSVGSGPVGGMTAVPPTLSSTVALHGAAPNPFNPATSIRFRLTEEVPLATLRIYDVAGRLVKTLHEGSLPAGDQQVMWRGNDDGGRSVASGVYLVRLEAGGQVLTRPMVLAR